MRKNYIFYVIKHWTLWQYPVSDGNTKFNIYHNTKTYDCHGTVPKIHVHITIRKTFFLYELYDICKLSKNSLSTVLYSIEYNTV